METRCVKSDFEVYDAVNRGKKGHMGALTDTPTPGTDGCSYQTGCGTQEVWRCTDCTRL